MTKYAFVEINYKFLETSKRLSRRVLISYKNTKPRKHRSQILDFKGTKLIAVDSYFVDNNQATTKYKFRNKYYKLIDVTKNGNPWNHILKGNRRPYHCFVDGWWHGDMIESKPYLFKAETDEDALITIKNQYPKIELIFLK